MQSKDYHKKRLLKEEQSGVHHLFNKKTSSPLFIGRAFTLEELQSLLSSLTCGDALREISGVAVFSERLSTPKAKYDRDIFDTDSAKIDVTETQVIELVSAAIIKNEAQMIKAFEKSKKTTALNFLAFASFVPPEIQKKAKSVLKRMHISKQSESVPKHFIHEDNYKPEDVAALIARIDSSAKEVRISGAIEFVKEYPRIVPTVSRMPLLSVTEVTIKVVEIIKQNMDAVLSRMAEQKMVPELIFIASLHQIPEEIRVRAKEIIGELRSESQKTPALQKSNPSESEVSIFNSKAVHTRSQSTCENITPNQKTYVLPKQYSSIELQNLIDGLNSVEKTRVVSSAIEFLKNYDIIAQKIAETPMLTVTEVTLKAVKVIDNYLDVILKELANRREMGALNFLAHSRKFSLHVNKKADSVIEKLVKLFKSEESGGDPEENSDECADGKRQ